MTPSLRLPGVSVGAIGLVTLLLAACAPEPASERAPAEGRVLDAPYFPPNARDGTWETITPAGAGFDEGALEEVMRYAGTQRSSGVVVLFDGRILVERYWPVTRSAGSRYDNMVAAETSDEGPIEDVASAQKNIVSFLAGVAEGKGLLDLTTPVSTYLGEGWSNATTEQETEITVEHLLSMTSGLLIDYTFEAPAGEKWRYNTNVYSRMLPILEAASGMSVDEYTTQWLLDPIGMTDSSWVSRPWITEGGNSNTVGFGTTARDLARFGLLFLRGGLWNSVDVLGNSSYIERSTSPSQALNPAYGYLWWLNGQSHGLRANGNEFEGSNIPSAPSDLYAAQGALGRRCYVVPSMNLVVTRLGDAPEADFDNEFWRRLVVAGS